MHRPKVVDKQVENTQNHDQEARAPPSLESNHHHDASAQAEHRDNDSCERPFALNDESDEKEDEQHSACKLEVDLAVGFAQAWQTGKDVVLLGRETVGENHEQTTNYREVAEEEVEIENETVTETLDDDNAEQCGNRDLGVLAHDYGGRGSTHDLETKRMQDKQHEKSVWFVLEMRGKRRLKSAKALSSRE